MLKFKKGGKILGVLKDDATEPEGEAFKFKDTIKKEDHIETAEAEKELAEETETEDNNDNV